MDTVYALSKIATQTGALYMRVEPGTRSHVMLRIPEGSEVERLTDEPINGFHRVRYIGQVGYCAAAYIEDIGVQLPEITLDPERRGIFIPADDPESLLFVLREAIILGGDD